MLRVRVNNTDVGNISFAGHIVPSGAIQTRPVLDWFHDSSKYFLVFSSLYAQIYLRYYQLIKYGKVCQKLRKYGKVC